MFPNPNCICVFLEAAPKVSQSQPESDVPISKPFPVMGGHPVPESGKTQSEKFGLYHCTAPLFLRIAPLFSSCRCNPSSGPRPDHHRSAAAHDQLSSQTRSSQAEESPTPHHRGVRLPHQRHVPVASQPGGGGSKHKTWERETWVSSPEPDRDFLNSQYFFMLETSQLSAVMNVSGHAHTESLWLVNLLLRDAAFKANDTYSDACEFIFMLSYLWIHDERVNIPSSRLIHSYIYSPNDFWDTYSVRLPCY